MAVINSWDIKMSLNMAGQQYRAFSDCTVEQAGLTLCWTTTNHVPTGLRLLLVRQSLQYKHTKSYMKTQVLKVFELCKKILSLWSYVVCIVKLANDVIHICLWYKPMSTYFCHISAVGPSFLVNYYSNQWSPISTLVTTNPKSHKRQDRNGH